MRRVLQSRHPLFVVALLGVLAIGVSAPHLIKASVISYERLSVLHDPSAERAFSYGSRHLDHAHPFLYDISAAEFFYRKTLEIDPEYPYARHQLARISFLRGQYLIALTDINAEIEMYGDAHPNSYYVRGLIHGFNGEYGAAAKDYERFFEFFPHNWAALNDYAWVLLKNEEFEKARDASARGLAYFPDNPWLLNSLAIASFELGDHKGAYGIAQKASSIVEATTEREWSAAYPGNDPSIAREGLNAFQAAVERNKKTIESALISEDEAH